MAKVLVGVVAADKADKTITVSVRTRRTHPIYRKQYTVSNKILAHDEKNEAKLGDKVSLKETRPISKRKSFTLEKIIDRPAIREDQSVSEVTKADDEVVEKPKVEKVVKAAESKAEKEAKRPAKKEPAKKSEEEE